MMCDLKKNGIPTACCKGLEAGFQGNFRVTNLTPFQ